MNIVNVDAVEIFCAALAARAGGCAAARDWLVRNLRRHILREADFHRPVADGSALAALFASRLEDPPEWARSALAKGEPLHAFDPALAEGLAARMVPVVDWMAGLAAGDPSVRFERVGVADAEEAAEQWHATASRQRVAAFAEANGLAHREALAMLAAADSSVAALWPDDPEGARTILELPGGHRVAKISSRAALEREGMLMDHCVATYWPRVESGQSEILSLRDGSNLPLATMEVGAADRLSVWSVDPISLRYLAPGTSVLRQVKGRKNGRPPSGSLPALTEAIRRLGLAATERELAAAGVDAPDLTLEARIDVLALARDLPDIARAAGSDPAVRLLPEIAAPVRLLLRSNVLGPDARAALASLFDPSRAGLQRHDREETLGGVARVRRVRFLVPAVALSGPGQAAGIPALPAVAASYARFADEILASLRSRPEDVVTVEPTSGSWPSSSAFFAYCGRLSEWSEACERGIHRRRALASEAAKTIRERLRRDAALSEEARSVMMNALNVGLPRYASP